MEYVGVSYDNIPKAIFYLLKRDYSQKGRHSTVSVLILAGVGPSLPFLRFWLFPDEAFHGNHPLAVVQPSHIHFDLPKQVPQLGCVAGFSTELVHLLLELAQLCIEPRNASASSLLSCASSYWMLVGNRGT